MTVVGVHADFFWTRSRPLGQAYGPAKVCVDFLSTKLLTKKNQLYTIDL